jgi:hypothetical protein
MNHFIEYIDDLLDYTRGHRDYFGAVDALSYVLEQEDFYLHCTVSNSDKTPFVYFISTLVEEKISVYDFPEIRECILLFAERDPRSLPEVVHYLTRFSNNFSHESLRHELSYIKYRAEIIDILDNRIHNILLNYFPRNIEPLCPLNFYRNHVELHDMRQYLKYESRYLFDNL